MKKWQKVIIGIALVGMVGYGLGIGVVALVGRHARELVGVVLGGYERFTLAYTESMLAHLAHMPEVREMKPESCQAMKEDLEGSRGFFAVLAIGDAKGEPICTADAAVTTPLPTMKDRLYFQRVRVSPGMVVGEYAVSRTTGKQVLHFAYPIREGEQFKGFILASVNLEWFADEKVEEYIGGQGVEVMGVDQQGRLLFSYPRRESEIGSNVLTAEMVAAMVNKTQRYQIMRGYDGVYRVYSYKVVSGEEPMLFLVGVSLVGFVPVITGLIGFWFLAGAGSWLYASWVYREGRSESRKKK